MQKKKLRITKIIIKKSKTIGFMQQISKIIIDHRDSDSAILAQGWPKTLMEEKTPRNDPYMCHHLS